MVWIPPRWDHETIALDGRVHREEDNVVCVHWMPWCLPQKLCSQMLRGFLSRKTSEQSTKKVLVPRQKRSVWMTVMEYGNRAERKAGNDSFFGIGGSEEH